VIAERAEIQGEHFALVNADGELAALFSIEIVDRGRSKTFRAYANRGILWPMVICFECRRLEQIYASAELLCGQYPKSLMFVSLEDDRPLRVVRLGKEAKDILASHHRYCLIYRKIRPTTTRQT
jgi:hypothetical protein